MRNGTKCRIVLMSATMETQEYEDYFTMIFKKDIEKYLKEQQSDRTLSTASYTEGTKESCSIATLDSHQHLGDRSKLEYLQNNCEKSNINMIHVNRRPYHTNVYTLDNLKLSTDMLTVIDFPEDGESVEINCCNRQLQRKCQDLIERHNQEKHLIFSEEDRFNRNKNKLKNLKLKNAGSSGFGIVGGSSSSKNAATSITGSQFGGRDLRHSETSSEYNKENTDHFWDTAGFEDTPSISELVVSDAAYNLAIHLIFSVIPEFRTKNRKHCDLTFNQYHLGKESILIFLPGSSCK